MNLCPQCENEMSPFLFAFSPNEAITTGTNGAICVWCGRVVTDEEMRLAQEVERLAQEVERLRGALLAYQSYVDTNLRIEYCKPELQTAWTIWKTVLRQTALAHHEVEE